MSMFSISITTTLVQSIIISYSKFFNRFITIQTTKSSQSAIHIHAELYFLHLNLSMSCPYWKIFRNFPLSVGNKLPHMVWMIPHNNLQLSSGVHVVKCAHYSHCVTLILSKSHTQNIMESSTYEPSSWELPQIQNGPYFTNIQNCRTSSHVCKTMSQVCCCVLTVQCNSLQ